MTETKTKSRTKPSPYEQAKPLITLLPTDAGLDVWGLTRIDVLAFNVDGTGRALCRVYRDDEPTTLTIMGNEMGIILENEVEGVAFIEAPAGWTGGRPDALKDYDGGYFAHTDPWWGKPCHENGSDEQMAQAGHDKREQLRAERVGYKVFDRCLKKLGMRKRDFGVPPYEYGHCRYGSKQYERVFKAWKAARRGRATTCRRLLRKVSTKDRSLLAVVKD